ncbi:integration host factor, actinobacterial type [Paeniglutamicibacter cryotolerans]|uniref:GNAT superfamily N-acetyltransferase n=1 Tax=Paeniglutamicibacter cryotolerans TaxID=670079 RepID=A0A839QR61_9MICC|nr:integration host factor, actinobacterial type [Paeniglutamicibacter cryotolerans]MBB2997155.1 GNAT superfamily N-acetyltransferase [Paeniglutamicibacter cryotolerans]
MVLRTLSDEDRAKARAKALAARTRRAEIKKSFGSGALSITEILDLVPDDEALGRLRVLDLLESLPGVGEIRAAALMDKLGISPSRRLRGLGRKQREALIEHFGGTPPPTKE